MSRVTEIRYVGYGVVGFRRRARLLRGEVGPGRSRRRARTRCGCSAQGHDEPCVVRLRQSDANHVDVIALATDSRADVDALHAKVTAAGMPHHPSAARAHRARRRLWFPLLQPRWPAVRDFQRRGARAEPRDRALGRHSRAHQPHRAAFAGSPGDWCKFFTEVLGFRVSDWLGDFMCFLRCNSRAPSHCHPAGAALPQPCGLRHDAVSTT